jgi:hypothetical protein
MSAIPNDRRTRQLFLDAAIKRAQAKAREARIQASAESYDPGADVVTVTSTVTTRNYADRNYAATVPAPRDADL